MQTGTFHQVVFELLGTHPDDYLPKHFHHVLVGGIPSVFRQSHYNAVQSCMKRAAGVLLLNARRCGHVAAGALASSLYNG